MSTTAPRLSSASPHYDRDALLHDQFTQRHASALITSRGNLSPNQLAAIVEADRAESDIQLRHWVAGGCIVVLVVAGMELWHCVSELTAAAFTLGSLLREPACAGCQVGQGRHCTCCDQLERVDSSALDVGMLIASGAMEPPTTRRAKPRPLTLTLRQRLERWVRRHLIDNAPAGF